jgi:hypothetical protein
MDTLTVEGWCEKSGVDKPVPLEQIRFHINAVCHRELEAAEDELRKTKAPEKFIEVDMAALELELPAAVGRLSDCRFRVYLGPLDSRGQFHLVGHRASDNALVYTNPVMVDQLG